MSNIYEEVLHDAEKAQEQCPVSYEIDLSKQYEEPRYLLRINGVGTIPRGDIQGIKAAAKNGKSYFCSILIASLLGCDKFGIESIENQQSVLYFDTEQCPRNTACLVRRVHKLLCWRTDTSNPLFRGYALRSMATEERLQFIAEKIRTLHPSLVIVDGAVDLLHDFNDIGESSRVIAELMVLSADNDCAIACVLHTNKAKGDSNMRGHLGSMLLQKASDVFEIQKDGGIFCVTQTDCRNHPVPDIAFSISEDGTPYRSVTTSGVREQLQTEIITDNMKKAFGNVQTLTKPALVRRYMELTGKAEKTAYNHIGTAVGKGILENYKDCLMLCVK